MIETKQPEVDLKQQPNNLQEIDISNIPNNLQEIDISNIPSPILARLIEEVRNEEISDTTAYNRMHNRHNRSR